MASYLNDDAESLRIVARLKPDEHNGHEEIGFKAMATKYDDYSISIHSSRDSTKPLEFEFDNVLGPSTTQDETFDIVAKNVMDDVFNGVSSTILCFGQTTAGKTHTIFGKEESTDPAQMGLLPRCIAYCIHLIQTSPDVIEASITISCIEIFEEKLKDLLAPQSSNKLRVRVAPSGETYVANLTQEFMMSTAEAIKWIEVIKSNRTKLGKYGKFSSPKSHCLACLTVNQKLADNTFLKARCYIGDLSGNDEEDESLNNLKTVIHSLFAKKKSIPYHKSKLTQILKDSLKGNAKTTVILNVSLNIHQREGTIACLKFGQTAKLIKYDSDIGDDYDAEEELEDFKKKYYALLEDQNASTKEYKELKQKYEESIAQNEKLTHQREKYKDIEASFNELKTKYKICQELIDEKRTKIKSLNKELESLQEGAKEHVASTTKMNTDIEELHILCSSILGEMENLEGALNAQQESIKRYNRKNKGVNEDDTKNSYLLLATVGQSQAKIAKSVSILRTLLTAVPSNGDGGGTKQAMDELTKDFNKIMDLYNESQQDANKIGKLLSEKSAECEDLKKQLAARPSTKGHAGMHNADPSLSMSGSSSGDEWKSGLRQRFELIDSDNDGVITLEDFAKFTRLKTPNSSDKQIKNIFAKMDTQKIGRVTWIEFEKCFRRFAEKKMALRKINPAGKLLNGYLPFDEKKAFEGVGGKGKLQKLIVWSDLMVRGFQCVWTKKMSNGQYSSVMGTMHLAKNMNQKVCKKDEIELAKDEYVNEITVHYHAATNCIYGMTVKTDKNKPKTFGVAKATKIVLKAPSKHSIHAFYGGLSNDHLSCIGAYALLNYHKP